jgi:hypothetical protein
MNFEEKLKVMDIARSVVFGFIGGDHTEKYEGTLEEVLEVCERLIKALNGL